MAALYVGLGIAMMSGISAMMQIGTNINKINIVNSFSDNYSSDLAEKDRKSYKTETDKVLNNLQFEVHELGAKIDELKKQK